MTREPHPEPARPDPTAPTPPAGGQGRVAATLAICRGVRRHLARRGAATVTEVPLGDGRRADLLVLIGAELWIIEIKSGAADFVADGKWPAYRAWCDRLLFAVDAQFPADLIPSDVGLLVADAYDAAELRPAPLHALPAARRKAMLLNVLTLAARRLHRAEDPGFDPLG